MTRNGVMIGEFQSFMDGVEVAEVSGRDVIRACGILGTRPPFRDRNEAELLGQEDAMGARDIAVSASRVMDVAEEVGRLDHSVPLVIFSRTGALAVRHTGELEESAWSYDQLVDSVVALDNYNVPLLARTHPVQIG